MNKEERADREDVEGKFKEFFGIRDLISEIRGPGVMRPCNNPSCTTCLCDCLWKIYEREVLLAGQTMTKKPRLLDLGCKAGGASYGLDKAGFDVTGLDIEPQKHYPFKFILGDMLTYPLEGYNAYWCSPPCQGESNMTPMRYRSRTPTVQMIKVMRERLLQTGKPFIIENVTGARKYLVTPVKLCGSQFGLPIFYHRYFECHGFYCLSRLCHHDYKPVVASGGPNANGWGKPRPHASVSKRKAAFQIDWMIGKELNQAIPWQYAEFLGKHLMQAVLAGQHQHPEATVE